MQWTIGIIVPHSLPFDKSVSAHGSQFLKMRYIRLKRTHDRVRLQGARVSVSPTGH
jgi:hypothetical protein